MSRAFHRTFNNREKKLATNIQIQVKPNTYGTVLYTNEQLIAPFETSYCNICTQKHAPLRHNDMNALSALCKADILQDGISGGNNVDMQALSPK